MWTLERFQSEKIIEGKKGFDFALLKLTSVDFVSTRCEVKDST